MPALLTAGTLWCQHYFVPKLLRATLLRVGTTLCQHYFCASATFVPTLLFAPALLCANIAGVSQLHCRKLKLVASHYFMPALLHAGTLWYRHYFVRKPLLRADTTSLQQCLAPTRVNTT